MLSLIFIEVVRAEVIQGFSLRFCFLFEIAVTGQNALSSFSIVCKKIWNELFVSLLPISRVLLLSILSSAIWIFFRFSAVYFLLKILLLFGFSKISLGMKIYWVRWSEIEVTMFEYFQWCYCREYYQLVTWKCLVWFKLKCLLWNKKNLSILCQ